MRTQRTLLTVLRRALHQRRRTRITSQSRLIIMAPCSSSETLEAFYTNKKQVNINETTYPLYAI